MANCNGLFGLSLWTEKCTSFILLLPYIGLRVLISTGQFFVEKWKGSTKAGFECSILWVLNLPLSTRCIEPWPGLPSSRLIRNRANSAKPLPEGNTEEIHFARTYRRFYTAFQLRDLCNEIPIHAVARKFEVPRGFVQTLAQTCEGFAAGMIQFCDRMGWGMLKSTLEHMCDRLKAGAKSDLLELAKIPFVKSRTARIFWENGLKTLGIVAEAESKDLLPLLLLVGYQNIQRSPSDRDHRHSRGSRRWKVTKRPATTRSLSSRLRLLLELLIDCGVRAVIFPPRLV